MGDRHRRDGVVGAVSEAAYGRCGPRYFARLKLYWWSGAQIVTS
jgi:hypothetical protein